MDSNKNNEPPADKMVLLVLQAVEELPLQEALRTLQRIIDMLNAAQIAAQTGEALALGSTPQSRRYSCRRAGAQSIA